MRLVFDCMIALMLIGILTAVVYYHRQGSRHEADFHAVHDALGRLYEQLEYRRALGFAETSDKRFPNEIDSAWFGEKLPVNVLVAVDQPWMDVAPFGDPSRHPPDPILRDENQAGFWYNPNLGLFRARVEQQLSEKLTLEMYNRVNGVSLSKLSFSAEPDRRTTLITLADGEPVRPPQPGAAIKPDAQDEDTAPKRSTLLTKQDEPQSSDETDSPQRRSLRSP